MSELLQTKKKNLFLQDHDYQKDLYLRKELAQYSSTDLLVLEEILYSPLKISVKKLAKNVDLSLEEIESSLEKIATTSLFTESEQMLFVDKKVRKYLDIHILPYTEDFRPSIDYVISLLQLCPIEILPQWYSIPRSSNDIMQSIIEKYLLTPVFYERHLENIGSQHPLCKQILDFVFSSPTRSILKDDLFDYLGISEEKFEECLFYLELQFVLFSHYQHGKIFLKPLQEWEDYLQFHIPLSAIEKDDDNLEVFRKNPFAAVEDMRALLLLFQKEPLAVHRDTKEIDQNTLMYAARYLEFSPDDLCEKEKITEYLSNLIDLLLSLRLADIVDDKLYACAFANEFIDKTPKERAFFIYKHPLLDAQFFQKQGAKFTEKELREAERAILPAKDGGWFLLNGLLEKMRVHLRDEHMIYLKKEGRRYFYALPSYSDVEKSFVHTTLYHWLFFCGIVEKAGKNGSAYLRLTSFGHEIFEE